MKKFISKHGKKIVLAVAIGGIVSSSIFGQGMPLVNEVHASSNVSAKKGVFTLDTVFVSNEYDPDIPAKDRKPVAGVEYEVYSMETNALVARGRSDAKGRFLVKNLPEGHYKWTQTHVPARYNPMTKDKTANGPQEYGYLSIHPTDKNKVIGGHLDVKLSIIEEEQMIEDGLLPRPPANGNGSSNKPPVTKPPVTKPPVTKPPVTPPAKDEGTVVTPPTTPPVKDDVTVNTPPVKDEGAEKDEVSPTEKPTENDKDSDAKDEVVTPPITNENGDLVNKDGDLVNKDGHLVDKDGNLVDKDGKIISKVDKDNTKDGDKNSSDRGADSKVEKGEARESNPDDVQTYDKGIAAFIALALSGVAGIVLLNRKKNNA